MLMPRTLGIALFFLSALILATCGQQETPADAKSKIYNPNGDSELALLMRDMFDEGMLMKTAIEEGRQPEFRYDPAAIFTAHATEPAKAASEAYQSMGKAYLAAAKALQQCEPGERKAFYQGMVHTCMACHEELCPGPTRKIRRMYFEEL